MTEATIIMAPGVGNEGGGARQLKARLSRIPGVDSVDFNYVSDRITVKFDPDIVSPARIKELIKQVPGQGEGDR
jgi:copper chaperone CopZ